mgnify:CR=1 FL=1
MKILVTGTAGFIGNQLALKLLERGEEVIGIDNLNDYYPVQLKLDRLKRLQDYGRYTDIRLDLADRAGMEQLFRQHQPQRVVNLAAQAGVRYSLQNPHAYIDSNIVGFINVLEGCRLGGVKRFIYSASSSVTGDNGSKVVESGKPTPEDTLPDYRSPYALTKHFGEILI